VITQEVLTENAFLLFLISIAIDRGVLLEQSFKQSSAYDKNFSFGADFSERIHIAFVTVGLSTGGFVVLPVIIIEYSFCCSSYASDFNCS
jgi:hypothetical protein